MQKIPYDVLSVLYKHKALIHVFRKLRGDSHFFAVREEITAALHMLLLGLNQRSGMSLAKLNSMVAYFTRLQDRANAKVRQQKLRVANDKGVSSPAKPMAETYSNPVLPKVAKSNKPKASVLFPWRDLRYSY